MNNLQIQRAVAEMRSIAAQAGGQARPAEKAEGGSFSGVLQNTVNTVNELQQDSSQKTDAFLRGENVPLTEVMIAGQKSKVAFTAVKEVRNHLLEAYRQISNMQV